MTRGAGLEGALATVPMETQLKRPGEWDWSVDFGWFRVNACKEVGI